MDHSDAWTLAARNGYALLAGEARFDDSGYLGTWRVCIEYCLPGERESPALIEVPYFQCDAQELRALANELRSWLAQPLRALATSVFEYSVDLAGEPSDRLILAFGSHPEVTTGVGGVGCIVELRHSALAARIAFATDATCLASFLAGIEKAMRRVDDA